MAKVAVTKRHMLQILFFRQVVAFLSLPPAISRNLARSLKTSHPGLHALHLTGAFVALAGSIWAVAVLPLTTGNYAGLTRGCCPMDQRMQRAESIAPKPVKTAGTASKRHKNITIGTERNPIA